MAADWTGTLPFKLAADGGRASTPQASLRLGQFPFLRGEVSPGNRDQLLKSTCLSTTGSTLPRPSGQPPRSSVANGPGVKLHVKFREMVTPCL